MMDPSKLPPAQPFRFTLPPQNAHVNRNRLAGCSAVGEALECAFISRAFCLRVKEARELAAPWTVQRIEGARSLACRQVQDGIQSRARACSWKAVITSPLSARRAVIARPDCRLGTDPQDTLGSRGSARNGPSSCLGWRSFPIPKLSSGMSRPRIHWSHLVHAKRTAPRATPRAQTTDPPVGLLLEWGHASPTCI